MKENEENKDLLEIPIYNSKIFKTYETYIKKHHPDVDINKILDHAGMKPPEIDDNAHWFNQLQAEKFTLKAIELTGDPNLSRSVGRKTVSYSNLGPFKYFAAGIMTPKLFLNSFSKATQYFTKATTNEVKMISKNVLQIIYTLKPGLIERENQCQNRFGTLESMFELFFKKNVEIDHPECIHKGGKHCVYNIKFSKTSFLNANRLWLFSFFILLNIPVLFYFLSFTQALTISFIQIFLSLSGMLYVKTKEKNNLLATIDGIYQKGETGLEEIQELYNNALIAQNIGKSTSNILKSEKLLTTIKENIEKHMNYDFGEFFIKSNNVNLYESFGTKTIKEALVKNNLIDNKYKNEISLKIDEIFETKEPLVISNIIEDTRFNSDFKNLIAECNIKSFLIIPVIYQGSVKGIICLYNRNFKKNLTQSDTNLLNTISSQLAISLENSFLYENLEEKVIERTKELRNAQEQLLETAHKAGMADIATGVLHNIGNVLTSVNVSSGEIKNSLQISKISGLSKAIELLNTNKSNLSDFLTKDPKGQKLTDYFTLLDGILKNENDALQKEINLLIDKVNIIRDIIKTQQEYAGTAVFLEKLNLIAIIEDSIKMQLHHFNNHNITLVKSYSPSDVVMITAQKSKLIHILINLIKNASEAMKSLPDGSERIIEISVSKESNKIILKIKDTGPGILEDNINKIFAHGFTTKKDGHGFGLHTCSNYMTEMNGSLIAANNANSPGATFTLDLPPS